MRLGYVIIHVPDVPAALDFYERAFGFERRFLAPGDSYGELRSGGTALAFAAEALIAQYDLGVRENRPDAAPAAVEIGLVTDDVGAAYARAIAEGCTAAKAPAKKPWGQTVAYVRDLNGFLVEICSPIEAQKAAPFDWHGMPITRATPITANYRNTQNVRRFFRAQCGEDFKFDRSFMAWMLTSVGITMGDAADEWTRRRGAAR